ncbi:MAG: hypothetical protein HKN87_13695 [Saprospiraceae bacterium]|nr:hypothetical protein [Saprospiraceae bacterium]
MNSTFSKKSGLTLLWLVLVLVTGVEVGAMDAADCAKADGLAATAITDHSAMLSWTSNPNHMMYEVEVRSKGRTPKFKWHSETMENSLMIDGLVPGSMYRFRVKAKCMEGGNSGSTKWHVFETAGMSPNESCPKAEELLAVDITGTHATLTWDGGDYATHFEVEVRSKGRTPTYFFERSQLDNMVIISGLALGGKYQFRVKTKCENGASSGSTKWSAFMTLMDSIPEPDTCPQPMNLEVDSITAHSAQLSWDKVEGSDVYQVILESADSAMSDTIVLMDSIIILAELAPLSNYFVAVRTLCVDGVSEAAVASFETLEDTTEMDTCPAIGNLIVDMITDTSAMVTWDTTEAAVAYDLELREMADSILNGIDSFETVEGSLELTDLKANTTYVVSVTAVCLDEGRSSPVEAEFATTGDMEEDSCVVPTDLEASLQDSSFMLMWSTVDSPTVQLQVRFDDSTSLLLDSILDASTFDFQHPLDDVQYAFRVKTICDSLSSSEYSEWESFPATTIVSAFVCDAPGDFSIDTVGEDFANLSWAGSDTVRYQIQVQTPDSLWGFILDSDSSMTFLTLTDLDQMTDFEVQVRSLCGDENSPYTEWLEFTTNLDSAACEAPTNLSAEMIDDSSALLKWEGSDSLEALVHVESTDSTSLIELNLNSFTGSITVSGLTAGVEYQYRVQNVCDSGDTSGYSYWYAFVLEDTIIAECNEPDSLMIDSVAMDAVLASWHAFDSGHYVYMLMSLDTTMAFEVKDTTADLHLLIDGLSASTPYQLRVKALCIDGESQYTEWLSFTTLDSVGETCDPAEDLILDSVSETMAWISWMGPDSVQYLVEAKTTDTSDTDVISLVSDEPAIHLMDLHPATEYHVSVRTLCNNGDTSEASAYLVFETMEIIIIDTCDTPLPMIDDITMHSAAMSWTSSSPGALYLLEVEQIGLTPYFNLITTSYDTSFLVEGLSPDGDYQWKITAFCSQDAYSECSPWMNFTTLSDSMEVSCPAPSGLAVSEMDENGALLSWDEGTEYIDFEVEVESLDTTAYYGQISIVTEHSISVEGLEAGGLYQFKVNALCNSAEVSEDSDWFEFGGMDTTMVDTAGASRSMVASMAYPNPVQETMIVKMPQTVEDAETIITVTDLTGRIVISEKVDFITEGEMLDFPVGHLREGVYQLLVTSPDRQYRQLVFKGEK